MTATLRRLARQWRRHRDCRDGSGVVVVAIVVAPLIQPAYRRRVMRLMRFEHTGRSESETTAIRDYARSDPLHEPAAPIGTMNSDVIAAAAERQRRIVRATVVALVVFMAGAGVMTRLHGFNWS